MLSLFIISSYICGYIFTYGIPKSLSATYYGITHKLVFSLCLILATILILPIALVITPEVILFLPFLTMSGIIFVGFTPNFNDSGLIDKVHTYSACLALICSLIWVAVVCPYLLLLWIIIIIYWICYSIKYTSISKGFTNSNIKFWSEIIMLITIYGILI